MPAIASGHRLRERVSPKPTDRGAVLELTGQRGVEAVHLGFGKNEPSGFDAIIPDVDNGQDGLTRVANEWLYSEAGLAGALRALRPGGPLAIWSAGPDQAFTKRLRSAGFEAEEMTVPAHAGKGVRHVIWMARRG